MAGITGLTGLTGNQPLQVTVADPGAPAAEVHGGAAERAHGQYEWPDEPFPVPWMIQPRWQGAPAPVTAPDMLGGEPAVAGQQSDPEAYADPTATLSHGGPWPARVSDYASTELEMTALQGELNEANRSLDSGVPESFTVWPPPASDKMAWERSPDYNSAGGGSLGDPGTLTGNNKTGWVRGQGWTVPGENINRFGFDEAHVSRFAPGSPARIPVPDERMMGAQRPMLVQLDGRHTYPIAGGGPFDGDTPGSFVTPGGELTGLPSDYQASPDPPTGPAFTQYPDAPVWGWNA